jgi:hypothetical protein
MAAPTQTNQPDRLAVGALHATIADRASERHLSIAAVARRCGVSYHRLIVGQPLRADEIVALETVLGVLEMTTASLTPAVATEVAVGPAPSTEG